MAGQAFNHGPIHTFRAAGTILAWRAVELDSNGDVTAANAIADNTIGMALQTVASGDLVEVYCAGPKLKAVASAAISIGAQLMVTASGAGKVSTAAGATAKSIGIALTAAANDGEVIEFLPRFGANQPANS